MIREQTRLRVADNSGAKEIECIRILGGSKKKFASIGDVIVVSIKDALPNSQIKKGHVCRAVIVRTLSGVKRQDGITVRFDKNAAVLIDKTNSPIGTRIFGPVTQELRRKKFTKVISLAREVI